VTWILNPVSGEPLKLTKQQAVDIEQARLSDVSKPTTEVITSLTKIASSTGGSLIIFLTLLPLVLNQLTKELPALAGILAVVSQAVKDPSKTANEFGEEMGDTILAVPQGFFSAIASAGFDIGADALGGAPSPFTPPEATRTGTLCERYEADLVEVKRKLDTSEGLQKVQGTFAWIAKLSDAKKAKCSRPGFVSQGTWDRVPS